MELVDYIHLYSNIGEVHSNRIHVLVSAFPYEISAKFCYETPRANLFNKAVDNIEDELMTVDEEALERQKSKQIKAPRNKSDYKRISLKPVS